MEEITLKHVLHIDDDMFIRTMLGYIFEDADISYTAVATEEQSYAAIRKNLPSVILMDSELGTITGLELSAKFAKDYKHIPIIFLTGHSFEKLFNGGMPENIYGLINKPFGATTIITDIKKILSGEKIHPETSVNDGSAMTLLSEKYLMHLTGLIGHYESLYLCTDHDIENSHRIDLTNLEREAHKISGTASLYGFKELADSARALESHLGLEGNRLCTNNYSDLKIKLGNFLQVLKSTSQNPKS